MEHKLNDNLFHVLRLFRSGANVSLQIDDLPATEKQPTGNLLGACTFVSYVNCSVKSSPPPDFLEFCQQRLGISLRNLHTWALFNHHIATSHDGMVVLESFKDRNAGSGVSRIS